MVSEGLICISGPDYEYVVPVLKLTSVFVGGGCLFVCFLRCDIKYNIFKSDFFFITINIIHYALDKKGI